MWFQAENDFAWKNQVRCELGARSNLSTFGRQDKKLPFLPQFHPLQDADKQALMGPDSDNWGVQVH